MAKTIASGQKSQDFLFLMLCMAWLSEKAVAIAPNGERKKAGMKASPSPAPRHP